MSCTYATLDTPAGPFTAVVDADGAVLASGWTADIDILLPLVHPGLRPAAVRRMADLGLVSAAIARYHDGELGAVDDVPVRQRSGPFLEHAWDVLRAVPAGAPSATRSTPRRPGVRRRCVRRRRRARGTRRRCSCRATGCCATTGRWAGSDGGCR